MDKKKAGFSLIEVVVIIAIIAVLIAVIAIPLSRFRQQQALQNSTNVVVSVLNDARAKTFAALDNSSYGVTLFNNKIVLMKGSTYIDGAATNETYLLETPVSASWSIAGGSNIISFERLRGDTNHYGTITLQLPSGASRIISVSAFGAVSRN